MAGGRFLVRAAKEGMAGAAQKAEACVKAIVEFLRIQAPSARGGEELVLLWDPESGWGTTPVVTALLHRFAAMSAYELERFEVKSFLNKFRTGDGKATVKPGCVGQSVFKTHCMGILEELHRWSWPTIQKMSLGMVRL